MSHASIGICRHPVRWVIIGCLGWTLFGAPAAIAQSALSEGPGPATVTDPEWYQFQGTGVSGAVQAIAVSDSSPGVIYLGATNGGVWKSVNNGASWEPLTDDQASLSIGALVVDPTNADHVIAGIGRTSSAGYSGGPLIGILSSDNGGETWTTLTPSGLGPGLYANFTSLAYNDGVILAGSDSLQLGAGIQGGVYRVNADGTGSWVGADISLQEALNDPSKPLPVGVPVTSLSADPSNANIIYAAVAGASEPGLNGIYRSLDNGATFTRILDETTPDVGSIIASSVNMRVATAADGTAYVVTAAKNPAGSSAQSILRLDPETNSWSALPVNSELRAATQGSVHLALAVDPTDSNVIYIGSSPPSDESGVATADTNASNLYRGVVDPQTGVVSWTDIGALATTTANPHSDFRAIAFDDNGNILVGSDGGIYENTAATPESNAWQPIMNGYVGGEMYGVAWNPVSKTVAGAFQDNGVSTQVMQGSLAWNQLLGADGTNVAINGTTLQASGQAVLYGTTQNLGFLGRFTLNSANNVIGTANLVPTLNGTALPAQTFTAKFTLDSLDPTWFAVGGSGIYVGQDDLTNVTGNVGNINVPVTDITGQNQLDSVDGVSAIAFGTRESSWKYALAAAALDSAGSEGLYVSPNVTVPDASAVRLDLPESLPKIAAVALDPSSPGQIFAVGNRNVFLIQADSACLAGASCSMRDLGTTLPGTLTAVDAVTAIDNNGVSALFVGGVSSVAPSAGVGNIYALQDDPTHEWESSLWTAFGTGLPNVIVTQLTYSYEDDLLAVATMGRGAWIIPDVTSYFGTATQIVLGNADLNSERSDDFTDGTTGGRPLVKVGAGTVTLTGTNSYTGGTYLDEGVLSVSRDANLGAPGGAVNFDGGALLNTAAFATSRGIVLNAADGGFETAAPLTLTGVISGGGSLNAFGPQVLTLSGSNTYSGATTIASGAGLALSGTGSISASSGVADNGAFDISGTSTGASVQSLSGTGLVSLGKVPLTLTNAAGTFGGTLADGGAAGGSGGSFTVAGGSETLTGANTYSGGTTIAPGATLALSQTGSIGNSSSVSDNGLLRVDGALTAGSLSVGSSGVLRGTGVIAAPTRVDGRLAAGNSPGTLTFVSPVALTGTSTTEFDLDGPGTGTGAGNYSRVVVLGSANGFSAGGTLMPLLRGISGNATNSFTPSIGQAFTVLSAAGGVNGSYSGLVQPAGLGAGTRFDALYADTSLTLAVTPALYGDLGLAGIPETANESALGRVLDATRPAAGVAMTGSQAGLYAPLYGQTSSTIPTTLQDLSPTIYGDNMMTALLGWSLVGDAVEQELDAQRGASRDPQAQAATGPTGRTVWLTGLGQFTNVNSGDAPGYNGSVGGVAAGMDVPLQPGLRAGLAFGFTSPNIQDGTGATISGDAFEFQAYGSFQKGIAFADVQAGGSFSETDITRPEPAYGVRATGNANGSAGGGLIRAGVRLPWSGWQVEPSLSLSGVSFSQDSLAETTGGATSLGIAGASVASVQTLLGTRIERSLALNDHLVLTPSARVGWLHELADTDAATQASFLALPGPSFTVDSASVGRNFAVLGLAATLATGGPLTVYASYASAFNGQSDTQDITGGLRVQW